MYFTGQFIDFAQGPEGGAVKESMTHQPANMRHMTMTGHIPIHDFTNTEPWFPVT